MNVRTIFDKITRGNFYYQYSESITENAITLYGTVEKDIPVLALLENTYVAGNKNLFYLTSHKYKTRKSYSDLYQVMMQNKSFVQWGKDETLFAAKGMLVSMDSTGVHPLLVLTVDVSDRSVRYEDLNADKFKLYLSNDFEVKYKSVFSKFRREFIPAILEEKPIDVISTFNIKKLFGSPEYPKFKTLTEMNEFSQNMLHGIIENART